MKLSVPFKTVTGSSRVMLLCPLRKWPAKPEVKSPKRNDLPNEFWRYNAKFGFYFASSDRAKALTTINSVRDQKISRARAVRFKNMRTSNLQGANTEIIIRLKKSNIKTIYSIYIYISILILTIFLEADFLFFIVFNRLQASSVFQQFDLRTISTHIIAPAMQAVLPSLLWILQLSLPRFVLNIAPF